MHIYMRIAPRGLITTAHIGGGDNLHEVLKKIFGNLFRKHSPSISVYYSAVYYTPRCEIKDPRNINNAI